MSPRKCLHCGGTEIVASIHLGKTAEAGDVGLTYRTAIFLDGTEPLLADLCTGCGSVTRLHLANVDRKWQTQNP